VTSGSFVAICAQKCLLPSSGHKCHNGDVKVGTRPHGVTSNTAPPSSVPPWAPAVSFIANSVYAQSNHCRILTHPLTFLLGSIMRSFYEVVLTVVLLSTGENSPDLDNISCIPYFWATLVDKRYSSCQNVVFIAAFVTSHCLPVC
jgi:hypothetical protein